MDFLPDPIRTPRQRLEAALIKRPELEKAGVSFELCTNLSIEQRVNRFIQQTRHGSFVIPHDALLSPRLSFSDKRGPFYDFIAEDDMRSIGRRLEDQKLPLKARWNNAVEIPAQLSAIRFGFPQSARYSVSLLDIAEAEIAYRSLRKVGRVVERKKKGSDSSVKIMYGEGGPTVTLFNIARKEAGEISVSIEGLPSTSHEGTTYDPKCTFYATPGRIMKPIFAITPSMDQHRVLGRSIYKFFKENIVKENYQTAHKQMQNRVALYMQDVLGFFLAEGVARKQYQLNVNHPFPRFNSHILQFARDLTQNLVFTEGRRAIEPAKYERAALFTMLYPAFRSA